MFLRKTNQKVFDTNFLSRQHFNNSKFAFRELKKKNMDESVNRYEPNALNHEPLLFWTHLDDQQRADLPQTLQQVHGVVDRDGVDGVRLGEDAHEFAQPVVLPVEETEHHPHQLGILDEGLLGPVDHRVGNKLLQRTCQGERDEVTTMWRILCTAKIDDTKGYNEKLTWFFILLRFRLHLHLLLAELFHFFQQTKQSSTKGVVHLFLLLLFFDVHTWGDRD